MYNNCTTHIRKKSLMFLFCVFELYIYFYHKRYIHVYVHKNIARSNFNYFFLPYAQICFVKKNLTHTGTHIHTDPSLCVTKRKKLVYLRKENHSLSRTRGKKIGLRRNQYGMRILWKHHQYTYTDKRVWTTFWKQKKLRKIPPHYHQEHSTNYPFEDF